MIGIFLDDERNPECFFHSNNPVGLINMRTYYQNAKKFKNA